LYSKIGGKHLKMNEIESKMQAIVTEVHRELFTVRCEQGEAHAKLKGSFYKDNRVFPVVGDKVLINYNENGASLIERVLERKSKFSRTDFSGHAAGYVKAIKEQVLAANFDYVFIVDSLNKNFNVKRITRYLSVAQKSGAKPVVILTKADLCDNIDYYVNEVKNIYDKVDICTISAKSGFGMQTLDSYLKSGTTIVLLGSSGVGKSTLVNAIAGEEIMKVSEIREDDSKGRHTTTHRQMIMLPSGVAIIDTPGIRELGMWEASEGIDDTFSDIRELIKTCKYSNCTHTTEPYCAIKTAIESRTLTKERWKLYCQLKNEDEWGKNKATLTFKKKAKLKSAGSKIKSKYIMNEQY
jgi:ribosome biogenesis GTPase